MTKTIAELWRGHIEPIRYLAKNNWEIKQLENLIQRNFEKLESVIDEDAKKILQIYEDCVNEYTMLIIEQAFCDGFSLGTKILMEALSGAEQLI